MLTVEEVKKNIDKVRFGKTKQKLIEYLEKKENQDKVFTGKEISKVFPSLSKYTILNYLRMLTKDKIIDSIKIDHATYYSSKKTIDKLERFKYDRKEE